MGERPAAAPPSGTWLGICAAKGGSQLQDINQLQGHDPKAWGEAGEREGGAARRPIPRTPTPISTPACPYPTAGMQVSAWTHRADGEGCCPPPPCGRDTEQSGRSAGT